MGYYANVVKKSTISRSKQPLAADLEWLFIVFYEIVKGNYPQGPLGGITEGSMSYHTNVVKK